VDEFDLMIAVGIAVVSVVCLFAVFGIAMVFLRVLG